MAVPVGICCVCNNPRPLTAFSTLGDGRELGLCYACGVDPKSLRIFLDRFVAASERLAPPAATAHAAAD